MFYFHILLIIVAVSAAEGSYVKMSYVTDFYFDKNYYIFDQHNVTMLCEFNQDPYEVIWRIETHTVYYYWNWWTNRFSL